MEWHCLALSGTSFHHVIVRDLRRFQEFISEAHADPLQYLAQFHNHLLLRFEPDDNKQITEYYGVLDILRV
jgi:hypothetical protein